MEYTLAPAAGFSRIARRNDPLGSIGRTLVFGFNFALRDGLAAAALHARI